MNSKEIEHNVKSIFENFSKEEFIYNFLIAYGISKTSVTRLKKGDFNLSKTEGEVLYKKKIFFKEEVAGRLLSTIDSVSKDERILKHKPRFVILTDFKTLVAKDLRIGTTLDISLIELPKYFNFFLPLAGSEVYNATNDNEADRNASYKMADLYDLLIEANPNTYNSKEKIHNLNIFLSRLLFCFFAEDTEIFEEDIFTNTLIQHTAENGSDTHEFLNQLFERLNIEDGSSYPDYLERFPYVNGGLFQDKIDSPIFTAKARIILKELGDLRWNEINPDIFGSMIQAVVIPEYRSDLGMHYTSVPNILKLIKPLFLDELYEEFEKASSVKQLRTLINRISKIKFFDPACGSGNFLIISYKEIRLLEIRIIEKIVFLKSSNQIKDRSESSLGFSYDELANTKNPEQGNLSFTQSQTEIFFTQIQLTQFYGIELDDFAHEMAILSLWLAEHQMNRLFEDMLFDFGRSRPILPLKEAGQIQQGNATRVNWNKVCPIDKKAEVYIIGNPPYLGARLQDEEQKKDMGIVFHGIRGYNNMDYIVNWFYKAKNYIRGYNAKAAFVSTNSICQGEQVALIWPHIISNQIEIDYAYQSFKWTNNAKGNAGVTVIIVSIRNISNSEKFLFTGSFKKLAKNISPYLIDSPNTIIYGRSTPLSKIPELSFGNMPNDGGHLLLNEEERKKLISENSDIAKYIKPFKGSSDYLRGNMRFCIWLNHDDLEFVNKIPKIRKRIEKVKELRKNSNRVATQVLAENPHLFGEIRHQDSDSLLIPRHSSEHREYIPIGFFNSDTIIADSAMAAYNVKPWLFSVITSRIHMVWVRTVGGKIKSDYRYSAKLCYNTFPFPEISTKQKENLNLYVFAVLDERAKHPSKTMAQLYDSDKMPKGLKQAHQELDEAVEKCYRLQPFKNDSERLEHLFKLYEEMVKKDTLFAKLKKTRKKKSK